MLILMFSCQICFLKSSLGSCDLPQKCWARSVQLFWRLLDSNKHTNKQRIYYAFKALRSPFSLDNFIFELLLWNSAILYNFLVFGGFFFFNWRIFKKMSNYLQDFFFLKILMFHKPFLGSCEVPNKN